MAIKKSLFPALLCVAAYAPSSALFAEEALISGPDIAEDDRGYLTFFLDNDLFGGTDQDYTNGARISYITDGEPVIKIPAMQKGLEKLSGNDESLKLFQKIWGFRDPKKVKYSYGFSLTQLMFTPATFNTPTPPAGERPYAGWSSIGFSLHAKDEHALNSIEFSFGLVGPHAYAEQTQDAIHDIRDIEKFQGWDSQIPDEFTFNIFFNQRRRWTDLHDVNLPFSLEVDGFHETGFALGNYKTDAHIGFLVRLGWNLPTEFSDPRLTATANTQKLYSDSVENTKGWSLYAIFGARGSGVLHDITLDGPVFRDYDTNVDREPWVGEVFAGFGVRLKDWEFNYVHTLRSRQFETQEDSQSFGSIAIRTRF